MGSPAVLTRRVVSHLLPSECYRFLCSSENYHATPSLADQRVSRYTDIVSHWIGRRNSGINIDSHYPHLLVIRTPIIWGDECSTVDLLILYPSETDGLNRLLREQSVLIGSSNANH
jgi:hypothetical protein